MLKNKIGRRLMLLASLILLLNAGVNTTFGYIVTEADSLTNTFVPPEAPAPDDIAVTVTVHKTVKNTGKGSIGPDGFEFVLENVMTGERMTLESDADGKAVFILPFTAADVGRSYTYRLSETDEGMAGVTYDTAVYDITVAVSLGEDGKLIAAVTMNGNATEAPVATFENTYHAAPSALPITGDDGDAPLRLVLLAGGAACLVLALLSRRYRAGAKRQTKQS